MLKIVTIVLIIISYLYIDAPLVHYIHNLEINKIVIFKIFTHIPDVLLALLVIFFILFLILFNRLEKSKLFNVLFLVMISVAVSIQIKDLLKYVFGRYWPDTWINGNPSLLVNNVYGFQFFQKGAAFQSFPSGHTTVTFAFFTVLIYFYPKYKFLFLIPCALLALGQILMHYHFLSDVIAGGLLGWQISTVFCQFYEKKYRETYSQ